MLNHRDDVRDFPGRRWLNLSLRAVHLAGIVLLGAALLGAGEIVVGAWLTLLSGLGMFAGDTWANPAHLREVAGCGCCSSWRWSPSWSLHRRRRCRRSGRSWCCRPCLRTPPAPCATGACSEAVSGGASEVAGIFWQFCQPRRCRPR
ncbi:MAG: hypothetical protein HZT41_02465 [Dechloromonas sp.]|nr:MAG: hypothetical protein HZT41_02465 [Dechloromonas sp.]